MARLRQFGCRRAAGERSSAAAASFAGLLAGGLAASPAAYFARFSGIAAAVLETSLADTAEAVGAPLAVSFAGEFAVQVGVVAAG